MTRCDQCRNTGIRVDGVADDPSWYIQLATANDMATEASDKYGLPQTVYKTRDTCGWAHTNPFSKVLRGAQLHSTWLPANYFS